MKGHKNKGKENDVKWNVDLILDKFQFMIKQKKIEIINLIIIKTKQ